MGGASDQKSNRYMRIIERIFFQAYVEGSREVVFERDEITQAAQDLGIEPPKNLGDLVYTFRYRGLLPESIRAKAPAGEEWTIRSAGKSRYRFVLATFQSLAPNALLAETKVPDSTPGMVARYALSDEQALLARLRYNRLIDIFTGVTCYSLHNHLRTTAPAIGQIETDEVYLGIDRQGVQYVIPVQAKGGNDKLGVVQVEQDLAMCADKFPALVCLPIAAQFMGAGLIALLLLREQDGEIRIAMEKHYRLVPPQAITPAELDAYRQQLVGDK
ncbi:MAG: endonuclease [Ktedonobacterales bacterium]